jgi:fructose-1,6-bisphosphatase/inositol monophosphatase family enzyme
MNFGREIEVAQTAAKRASRLALKHQETGFTAESKPDESPVTIADRESEKLIASMLTEAFPDDGILGEEGSQKESRSGRRWIIDPIDGTRDFVRGNFLWSVLIGLEQDNEVVAGVIHLPLLDQTCWAARGAGAWRNDSRLRVSSISDPTRAVVCANPSLPWTRSHWAQRWLGGTPDAILLAAGEADIWIEPKVAAWDLAAAHVILEEAGAVFFDFSGARTIYGGSAVACTPGLETEVRAFLRST